LKDTSPMTFGEHSGKPMSEVPDSYLTWLYEQDWLKAKYPDVHEYIVRSANCFPDLILKEEDKFGK